MADMRSAPCASVWAKELPWFWNAYSRACASRKFHFFKAQMCCLPSCRRESGQNSCGRRISSMPIVKSGEARIHYALEGQGGTPVLVFSNSLGTNYSMWDQQIPELRRKLRVLRYDTRGHGQSSVTPGPYSIEHLGRDVIALLDALDLDRVHFCGLSMGGMIGMWLGANAPERLDHL